MNQHLLAEFLEKKAEALEEEAEDCKENSHFHGHTHYQRSDTLKEIAQAFRDLASVLCL